MLLTYDVAQVGLILPDHNTVSLFRLLIVDKDAFWQQTINNHHLESGSIDRPIRSTAIRRVAKLGHTTKMFWSLLMMIASASAGKNVTFHFISFQFCFVLFPMHTLSCGETRFSNLASVLSIFQKGEGEKWLLVSCICARWFLQKGITHHTMIITVGQTNNVYSVSVYIQLYPFCVLPFCFWLIHPSHRDHLRSRRIILDDSKPV